MTVAKQRNNNGQNRDTKGRFTSGRWKPGESGNPKGRPKRKDLMDELCGILEKDSGWEKLAQALFDQAISGNAQIMRLILERLCPVEWAIKNAPIDESAIVDLSGLSDAQLYEL